MATERDEALWLDAQRQLSIVELAECTGISTAVLRELVEYGALATAAPRSDEWVFRADCVARVRAAVRVCRDLDLDTPVLALVLSYLERIHQLEAELRHLEAQLGDLHR